MIRNAVLHLLNEQPLIADLPTDPAPGDFAVICTNLRTKDGKRPFFADSSASTFVFPLTQMRFVEMPVPASAGGGTPVASPDGSTASPSTPPSPVAPALPAAVQAMDAPVESQDLELDEDLLRRVREL